MNDNPYCQTTYTIEKEPYGTTFKDVHRKHYTLTENSEFITYKLQIMHKECVGRLKYLRFTLPSPIKGYAYVNEYSIIDGVEMVTGRTHFHNKEYLEISR